MKKNYSVLLLGLLLISAFPALARDSEVVPVYTCKPGESPFLHTGECIQAVDKVSCAMRGGDWCFPGDTERHGYKECECYSLTDRTDKKSSTKVSFNLQDEDSYEDLREPTVLATSVSSPTDWETSHPASPQISATTSMTEVPWVASPVKKSSPTPLPVSAPTPIKTVTPTKPSAGVSKIQGPKR